MIEFNAVGMRYGREALFSDVNLKIEPGEFLFLTGPSGAGKTTFLDLAIGALTPTEGAVSPFGAAYATLDRDGLARMRRRIGMVAQAPIFLDHLSVEENIVLPLWAAGQSLDASRRSDLDALLHWVGLEHRRKALPPVLSSGERQRAALARAVILSPDLILADEPTGNVDPEMSERLLGLFTALHEMGKSLLIATHDRALIRAAASRRKVRVLRLAQGRLERAEVTV